MTSCHEMKQGEVYICEECGLEHQVIKECTECGTDEGCGCTEGRSSECCGASSDLSGGW